MEPGLPSLKRAIDEMLFDLEELNLKGVDRVPASLRDRASRIFALLPDRRLRPCHRVPSMMDMLFHAQQTVGSDGNPSPDQLDDGEALQCA